MPSTIPLSRSITLASRFINLAPLTVDANDPAFSNADWVRQFLMAPPFAWPWNRSLLAPVDLIPGVSDYVVPIPSFGWLEKATVFAPLDGSIRLNWASKVLTVWVDPLGPEQLQGEPDSISTMVDDGQGNITFRVTPAPNAAYQLHLVIQNAPPLFANLTDKWTPIPDKYSYLYNQGMRALAYNYRDDPRFMVEMDAFLRQVIAANQGLSESQINIFLSERMNTLRQQQSVAGNSQVGRIGRGGLQA